MEEIEIYIKTEEINSGWFREPDPEDSWDIGDDFVEINALWASMKCPSYPFTQTDLEPGYEPQDVIYVCQVTYEDGCTFGYTSGLVEFVAAGSEAYCESIKADVMSQKINGSWVGYFATLGSVDVIRLDVL